MFSDVLKNRGLFLEIRQ